MNYFEILNLKTEPFSNSPDPGFFFRSESHGECLHKLEIALRLRRGLSVVLGDVGTGKTTLCRQLIRTLADDERVSAHLVLDPSFSTVDEFLRVLHEMFVGGAPAPGTTSWQMKEGVKNALFHLGVDEDRIVVLIVDEGQKLSSDSMELLRELLNYETNEAKLLQIVIFAQSEFEDMAAARPNFQDRINDLYRLGPLDRKDTREMVRFRLDQAKSGYVPPDLFTPGAYRVLHRATGGYPRKVVKLCHKVVLALLLQNKTKAGASVVKACAREMEEMRVGVRKPFLVLLALAGLTAVAASLLFSPGMPGRPWLERTLLSLTETTVETPARPVQAPPKAIPETAAPAPPAVPEEKAAAPAEAEETAPEATAEPTPEPVPETARETAAISPKPGDDMQASELDRPVTDPMAYPIFSDLQEPPTMAPVDDAAHLVLGEVRVRPGEYLSDMISNVYGIYRVRFLRRLLEFNPGVRDYNRIESGTRIVFPAMPSEADNVPGRAWWLVLEEYDTLQAAYAALREQAGTRPRVRLLSLRRDDGAPRFLLVAGGPRADRNEADAARRALPEPLADKVRVTGPVQTDAIYYSRVNLWKD